MATAKPAPVASIKPRFATVEDRFIGQLSAGEVSVPLHFKTKLLRQIRDSKADALDQFFMLLDGIGDARSSRLLDDCDAIETMQFVQEYFRRFEELQQASLGESSAS